MNQYNSGGFLYDRVDHVMQTHDMGTHQFRCWIFMPLNFVDRTLFDGADPVSCILFELS